MTISLPPFDDHLVGPKRRPTEPWWDWFQQVYNEIDAIDVDLEAQDLDFAGDTGSGSIDLNSQTFTVSGTASEISTTASGQTLTIGLPDSVIITTDLTVSTLSLSTGSITDSTGTISFGDENLSTTGTLGAAATTLSGTLTLSSVVNAGTDTDKFLVLDASNNVDFRTGSEVLSDIGGQAALTFGSENEIPTVNAATNDFDYSSGLTFDGTTFNCDSAAVFNESSADVDFRIESNNETHMFFVDAGNNRVGIGQASAPDFPFHVKYLNNGGTDYTIAVIEGEHGRITFKDDDRAAVFGSRFKFNLEQGVLVSDYPVFQTYVIGDTSTRFGFTGTGELQWGTGVGIQDVNLYRGGSDQLRTDDEFLCPTLTVSGVASFGQLDVENILIDSEVKIDTISGVHFSLQRVTNNRKTQMYVMPKGNGEAGDKTDLYLFGTDFLADSTNWEMLTLRASGAEYEINSRKGGTGTLRPIELQMSDTAIISIQTDAKFRINSNQIEDSGGSDVITFDGSQNTTLAENLTVGTGAGGQTIILNGVTEITPNTVGKVTHKFTTSALDEAKYEMKNDTTITNSIRAGGDSYFNGGDVMIGDTSPDSRFHVRAADGGPGDNNYAARIENLESTSDRGFGLLVKGGTSANDWNLRLTDVSDNNLLTVYSDGDMELLKDLTVTGDLIVSGTGPHVIGGTVSGRIQLYQTGAFTSDGSSNHVIGYFTNSTLTAVSGDTSFQSGMSLSAQFVTQNNSETITNIDQLKVNPQTITAGTDTVTTSSTVRITGAPSVGTNKWSLLVDSGDSKLGGHLTIGSGEAATDYSLTFDGDTNNGVIIWFETSDYFQFADDIMMFLSERIYFRSTSQYIYSSAGNTLNIGGTAINADTNEFIIGLGTNADPYLKMFGDTSTGIIQWEEDNDYFIFWDDLMMRDTERLWFHTKDVFEIYSDGTDLILNNANDETGKISFQMNDVTITYVDTNGLSIANGKEIRYYDTGSSNYVAFEAPALTSNTTYVLPDSDGTNKQVLQTDGSGNLSWGSEPMRGPPDLTQNITFSNDTGTVSVFTVTGDVMVWILPVCTTNIASAAAANIRLGTTTDDDAMIVDTLATDIDSRDIWIDASPTTEIEPADSVRSYIISDGNDVQMTLDAQVDSGVIAFYCWWIPLSSGATVANA